MWIDFDDSVFVLIYPEIVSHAFYWNDFCSFQNINTRKDQYFFFSLSLSHYVGSALHDNNLIFIRVTIVGTRRDRIRSHNLVQK